MPSDPFGEAFKMGVGSAIQMERRDGNIAGGNGGKIGHRDRVRGAVQFAFVRAISSCSQKYSSPRGSRLLHHDALHRLTALPRDSHRAVPVCGKFTLSTTSGGSPCSITRLRHRSVTCAAASKSDFACANVETAIAGNSLQRRFKRGGNSAGIIDIVAQIARRDSLPKRQGPDASSRMRRQARMTQSAGEPSTANRFGFTC